MEHQNITVKIDENGEVFIDIEGVKGKKCDNITKDIVKILGGIEKRENKPEYNDDDKEEDNIITHNT